MDKERWMEIFQANYMSGKDVMDRLPLNVDAEAFWQELLDRRKGRAELLPLYSPRSQAYWYVLTDKIVQASEILCSASLSWRQSGLAMTKQMTEEMYFTSFVEGVRMPFSDGVDFLMDKREPEDIQEQMLQNNRDAWMAMMGNISYPLDKKMVMGLAGILTEGMDGGGEGYRTVDGHAIACMGAEDCRVPKAFQIPDRMEELYSFFANPHHHPLIKAAASHAFILAARPFREGNERLARMVSAALLYQNGYGFFKDVSLSKVIAAEVPMYYNAMRETVREVNGGDLTYFIEYFLGMLIRALQRLLPEEGGQDSLPITDDNGAGAMPQLGGGTEAVAGHAVETGLKACSLERVMEALQEEGGIKYEIREGPSIPSEEHLLKTVTITSTVLHSILKRTADGEAGFTGESLAVSLGLSMKSMENARVYLRQRGFIRLGGEQGAQNSTTLAVSRDEIYEQGRKKFIFVKKKEIQEAEEPSTIKTAPKEDRPPDDGEGKQHISDVIEGLMAYEPATCVERKLGAVLKGQLEKGSWCLRKKAIVEKLGCAGCTAREIIEVGEQLGILYYEEDGPDGLFRIRKYVTHGIHLDGMRGIYYERFRLLYEKFGMDWFGVEDMAALFEKKENSMLRFANIYYRRGLLDKCIKETGVHYMIKEEALDLLDLQEYQAKSAG